MTRDIKEMIPTKNDFWFLPLGGANEIGMNLNVFGHNGQFIIVDLGVTFNDRLGVDIITPDPSFLITHRNRITGLVVTHAHEDHIGAIPYLWPHLKCPIYATPFTAAIIRQKLAEKPWRDKVKIIEQPLSSTFSVGDFTIEYITLTHSIVEPNALCIETPLGRVLHSGDWKLDADPLVGDATDITRLKAIGDSGVLALICDSTNVFNEGSSGSEQDVRDELMKLMSDYTQDRVTVACFASNVARIETIVKVAHAHNRKTALVGRSLHKMVQAAMECGYLTDLPELITDEEAMKMDYNKVCIIATGSQGENRAALSRIALGSHPVVEMCEHDVVLFSSRMIPGNEKSISDLQNALIHQGVRVVTSSEKPIHVSGHPAKDELRQMYEWIRPEVLIPVHGDARHLDEHARFGLKCGLETIVVPENGSLIQLHKNDVKEINFINTGRWACDGYRMISLKSSILKDRTKLSCEGAVFVTLIVDNTGQMIKDPTISMQGISDGQEDYKKISHEMYLALKNTLNGEFKPGHSRENALRHTAQKVVTRMIGKKPLVTVHVIEGSF